MPKLDVIATGLLVIALGCSGCLGRGPAPQNEAADSPGTPAVRLPPAWTATPVPTTPAPTPTAQPTSAPTEAPRLLTNSRGTAIPTAVWLEVEQASSLEAWAQHDVGSASLWLPDTWQVADLGGLGEVMGVLMAGLAQGMVDAFGAMASPDEGGTPSAESLKEMEAAFDIDFVMAADEQAKAALFLVGEPRPKDADLQDLLLKAISDNANEVAVEHTALVAGGSYPMARALLRIKDVESGQVSQQALYVILAPIVSGHSPTRPNPET